MMKCERRLEDFSTMELNTGSCKWEPVCELEGGCPLLRLSDEEVDRELKLRGVDEDWIDEIKEEFDIQ